MAHLSIIDGDPLAARALADALESAGHQVEIGPPQGGCDLILAESAALPQVSGGAIPVLSLSKPVRLSLLLTRIGQMVQEAGERPRIGPWVLDPVGRHLIHGDGHKVRLTDKEAAILSALIQAGGVMSRDQLLAQVWGYSTAIATHTLETHVYRLRRKLEDGLSPPLLMTEEGGYRLLPAQA